MIALQLSLQPGRGSSGGSGTSASPIPAGHAAGAPAHGPTAAAAKAPMQAGQAAPSGVSNNAAVGATVEAAEQAASRAFTVEATVDVDGKRRRLRRKRAASPDSPYHVPVSGSSSGEAAGGQGQPIAAAQHPLLPSQAAAPEPSAHRSLDAAATSEAEVVGQGEGGSQESASTGAGSGKGALVQRVIRQVCKLSLSGSTGGAAACPSPAASTGVTAEVPGSADKAQPNAGPGATVRAAQAARGACGAVPEAPLSAAAQTGDCVAAAVSPELQRGLLDSLSLVHDLSQVGAVPLCHPQTLPPFRPGS